MCGWCVDGVRVLKRVLLLLVVVDLNVNKSYVLFFSDKEEKEKWEDDLALYIGMSKGGINLRSNSTKAQVKHTHKQACSPTHSISLVFAFFSFSSLP